VVAIAGLAVLAAACSGSSGSSPLTGTVPVPATGTAPSARQGQSTIDVQAVVAYADAWSNAAGPNAADVTSDGEMANPAYVHFDDDDCANFVSQAWRAGGMPTDGDWWANAQTASTDWQNVNDLASYAEEHLGLSLSDPIAVTDDMPAGVGVGDVYLFHFNTESKYWNHAALDVRDNAGGQDAVEGDYSDSSGFVVSYGGAEVRHLDQHTNDRYRAPWNYGWLRNIHDPTMTSDQAIEAKKGAWVVKTIHLGAPAPATSGTTVPPSTSAPAATPGTTAASAMPASGASAGGRGASPVAWHEVPASTTEPGAPPPDTGSVDDQRQLRERLAMFLDRTDRSLLLPVGAGATDADKRDAVQSRLAALDTELPEIWTSDRAARRRTDLETILTSRAAEPNLYAIDDLKSSVRIRDVAVDGDTAVVKVVDTVSVHVPTGASAPGAVVHQRVDASGWSPPSTHRYTITLHRDDGQWKLEAIDDVEV
jgi:hypothetical protein